MSIAYFIVRTVLVLYTLRGEAEQVTCWRRDRVTCALWEKSDWIHSLMPHHSAISQHRIGKRKETQHAWPTHKLYSF